MRTRPLLLLALAIAVFTSRGFSQSSSTPATTPAAPVAPAPSASAPATPSAATAQPEVSIKDDRAHTPTATKGKDAGGHDTLSVDFPDEDIRNILRNVADLFELNLIIPETLQGKASIKLRDVTWRQIFQAVLQPVGYTYIEDGNIIKIVSNESLAQEPVTTEVFVINYARAADIQPTLQSLITTPGGKIQVDARSNSLIITEAPSRMNRIRPIIEQLDRATDQVMIESKFVEVTDRDVKNIGVNWSSLNGYNVSVGPDPTTGQFGTYKRTGNGTIQTGSNGTSSTSTGTTGSTSNGTTGGTTGTQTTGSNSSNSVTTTNGNPVSTSTTGTTTSIGTTGTTGTSSSTTAGTSSSSNQALDLLNTITGTATNDRTLSAVFSADQFKMVLSALQTLNTTKIVSNPTIVTLNNTEATINVGEEDPVPRYAYNEQKGSFEVSGFEFKPIGVLLKVTPQVNARGFIRLTLSPEVSQKNGSVVFGGASGTEIPIIATRKASTQVSLKDGYTMGIGGLLTQNATNGSTKVPVLGSLPLLGRLFRSNSHDVQTTNLIIFITAKSISADGAPIQQIFNSDRVRQLDMKRDELPGYRDGSDPFEPAQKTTPDNGKKTKTSSS